MNLMFYRHFRLISGKFQLKVPELAKKGYLGFLLLFIKTDKLSINITIQYKRYNFEPMLFNHRYAEK